VNVWDGVGVQVMVATRLGFLPSSLGDWGAIQYNEKSKGDPEMLRKADPDVAERAKQIYNERLKPQLEASSPDQFVAIEPDSGEFFLGATLSEAIGKSRQKYPDRLAHVIRVGHQAAVHFGLHTQ